VTQGRTLRGFVQAVQVQKFMKRATKRVQVLTFGLIGYEVVGRSVFSGTSKPSSDWDCHTNLRRKNVEGGENLRVDLRGGGKES